MLIIRILAILMVFTAQFSQGAEQETEDATTTTTTPVEEQKKTVTRDAYRQRWKNWKQEMEALFEEIRSTLQAEEDVVACILQEIEEKFNRFKQLPYFSETLPNFEQEFLRIKSLLHQPEELFVQATAGHISLDREKHLASFDQTLIPLDQFINKWEALANHACSIFLTTNQSLWFEKEWEELIGNIISDPQKIDGDQLYRWISLLHLWQQELTKSLESVKSNGILAPCYKTIVELIRLLQERGKVLWKIASFNVANIPSDYVTLDRMFFAGGNSVKKFLCPTDEYNLALYSNLTSSTLTGIQQNYQSKTVSLSCNNPTLLSFHQENDPDTLYCIYPGYTFHPMSEWTENEEFPSNKLYVDWDDEEIRYKFNLTPSKIRKGSIKIETSLLPGKFSKQSSREALKIIKYQIFDKDLGISLNRCQTGGFIEIRKVDLGHEIFNRLKQAIEVNKTPTTADRRALFKFLAHKYSLPLHQFATKPNIRIPNNLAIPLTQVFTRPEGWKQKMTTLKEQLQPLRHVGFIVESLKNLWGKKQLVGQQGKKPGCYNVFKKTYLKDLDCSEDILTPWASGIINGHKIRMRQSMARKALCLDSNGPLCFGISSQDNLDANPTTFETSIHNLRFITKYDLPISFAENDARHKLEISLGFRCDPSPTFMILEDISYFKSPSNRPKSLFKDDQIYQKTREYYEAPNTYRRSSKRGIAIIQRDPPYQVLADFLTEVAKGSESLDRLDPDSVVKQTLFCLLTGSSASPANFKLIPNEKNLLELQRINRDFAIDPYHPNDAFLHPSFYRYYDQGSGDTYKHALVGGNIFYLLPPLPISDAVKAFFQKQDFLFLMANWFKELKVSEDYVKDLMTSYGDVMGGWHLNFRTHPSMIQQLYQNWGVICKKLDEEGITCWKIFQNVSSHEYQCYEAIFSQVKTKLHKNKAPIFFKQAIPMVLEDLSDYIKDVEKLGGTFSCDGENIGINDLESFEDDRKKIIEIISKNQEEIHKCKKLIEGISSLKSQKFFRMQYLKAKNRGTFTAQKLFEAWKLLQDIDNRIVYEDLIGQEQHLSWKKVPIASGYIQPALAQEGAKNVTSDVTDMISRFIACTDITSYPPTQAAEIGVLLFGLLDQLPNTPDPSWKELYSTKLYSTDLPKFIPEGPFQTFLKKGDSYIENIRQKDTQKQRLRVEQITQYEGYIEILKGSKHKEEDTPSAIISLFEQLWLGTTPKELISSQDRRLVRALCYLLHLGFNSVELRPAVGDHYVPPPIEELVEFYQSSQTLSLDIRETMLSHRLTLLYLAWFAGIKGIDPSFSFPAGFIEESFSKSKTFQKTLEGELSLGLDDPMEILTPEIFYKFQQKPQTHKGNKEKVWENFKKRSDALDPLENQGSDFDWIPKGHRKNFLAILEEGDQTRMLYAAAQPLSLRDAATEVFNRFNINAYITGIITSPRDYENKLDFQILRAILELASCCPINISKINNKNWGRPEILATFIRSENASDEVLSLLIALQLDCNAENVELKSDSLKITGLKKGLLNKLCNVLDCFSKNCWTKRNIHTLDLSSNQISSLINGQLLSTTFLILISPLNNLTKLKKLILSDNPIHHPAHLISLLEQHASLEEIVLKNTYTPQFLQLHTNFIQKQNASRKLQNQGIRPPLKKNASLIIGNTASIDPKHFDLTTKERIDIVKSLQKFLGDHWLERNTKVFPSSQDFIRFTPGISYLDMIASIVEQLVNFWDLSLVENQQLRSATLPGDDRKELLDALNDCNRLRQDYNQTLKEGEERPLVNESAFELAFAIKFGLRGTTPGGLVFHPHNGLAGSKARSHPSPMKSTSLTPGSCRSDPPKRKLPRSTTSTTSSTIKDSKERSEKSSSKIRSKASLLSSHSLLKEELLHDLITKEGTCLKCLTISGVPALEGLFGLLRPFSHLQRLNLISLGLTKLELPAIQTLLFLDVSDNQLTSSSLEELKKFPKLHKLNISRNKIKNLDSLCSMKKLVYLDASDNEINDFSSLFIKEKTEFKLENVESLNFCNNNISMEDFEWDVAQRYLPKSLKRLNLSGNKLTFVPIMERYPPKLFDIRHNNIDIRELYQIFSIQLDEFIPMESTHEFSDNSDSLLVRPRELKILFNDNNQQCYCAIEGKKLLLLNNTSVELQSILEQLRENRSLEGKEEKLKELIVEFIINFYPCYLNTKPSLPKYPSLLLIPQNTIK